jgi:hypothetical protein
MSLTSFIAQPDVKAKLEETFPLPRIRLEKRALIEPLTTHYALVGTAFDYLLRFALQQKYAHAVDQPWIAEQALSWHGFEALVSEKNAYIAQQSVEEARKHHAHYLLDGTLTDDLLRSVLLLAQIDPLFRAGIISEPFGKVDGQDIEDLRHLFTAIPFENLKSQSLCLLNPTFGASGLVRGADVDLILDGVMVDIKTTKHLRMNREYIHQLLGYYTLSLLNGVTGMSKDQTIREVGVYFSRHGYLYTFSIEHIASEATFANFASWFAQRAKQQL